MIKGLFTYPEAVEDLVYCMAKSVEASLQEGGVSNADYSELDCYKMGVQLAAATIMSGRPYTFRNDWRSPEGS